MTAGDDQTGDQAGGGDPLAPNADPASPEVATDEGDDAVASITLTLGPGRVDIKV